MKEYEFATFTEEDFDEGFQLCPLLSIGRDKPVSCVAGRCEWYVEWAAQELYGCALRTSIEKCADVEAALNRIGTGTDFIPDAIG